MTCLGRFIGHIRGVPKVSSGCPFHTRCPYRQPICGEKLLSLASGRG